MIYETISGNNLEMKEKVLMTVPVQKWRVSDNVYEPTAISVIECWIHRLPDAGCFELNHFRSLVLYFLFLIKLENIVNILIHKSTLIPTVKILSSPEGNVRGCQQWWYQCIQASEALTFLYKRIITFYSCRGSWCSPSYF